MISENEGVWKTKEYYFEKEKIYFILIKWTVVKL